MATDDEIGMAARELADWQDDRAELLALGHREGSEALRHCDAGIAEATARLEQLRAEREDE